MKNVVLLGSTGSIGTSTIKVAEDLPDRIRLVGLAAGSNLELLLEQTRKPGKQVAPLLKRGRIRFRVLGSRRVSRHRLHMLRRVSVQIERVLQHWFQWSEISLGILLARCD